MRKYVYDDAYILIAPQLEELPPMDYEDEELYARHINYRLYH